MRVFLEGVLQHPLRLEHEDRAVVCVESLPVSLERIHNSYWLQFADSTGAEKDEYVFTI